MYKEIMICGDCAITVKRVGRGASSSSGNGAVLLEAVTRLESGGYELAQLSRGQPTFWYCSCAYTRV